ncbi:MAG: DUF3419 family protein [Myxococcales bacterium]|jgi:S-adenosylmethionine:diacylglycerol 3-amino-3-carboxypropyl transferase
MPDSTTAYEAGRFDGAAGPGSVLFGRTYEDPEIERAAFPRGGRVFCIASAGCTARHLAGEHEVVAVDINPAQVHYARARLAGEPAVQGKAERVMAGLRRLMPLAGIRRQQLEEFVELGDPAQQQQRWQQLCTARFRLGMDTMFSFTGLRAVYASPFLELLPPRFGGVLLSRLERGFATHPNRDNPWARALLLGDVEGPQPPATGSIALVHADAASFLEQQPAGSFQGLSLSNILDGASDEYRQRLFAAVRRAASDDAAVVLRSFAEPGDAAEADAARRDRSMLWGSVRVARARDLAAD